MEYDMPTKRSGRSMNRGSGNQKQLPLEQMLFKIINEEGMWQELICNKFLKTKNLAKVQAKPTDSPFWKGLMSQKETFFKFGSFLVGNGEGTRF
jgi:hypothetical protein